MRAFKAPQVIGTGGVAVLFQAGIKTTFYFLLLHPPIKGSTDNRDSAETRYWGSSYFTFKVIGERREHEKGDEEERWTLPGGGMAGFIDAVDRAATRGMTIVVTSSNGERIELYSAINVTDFIIGSIIYLGGTRTEGHVCNEF